MNITTDSKSLYSQMLYTFFKDCLYSGDGNPSAAQVARNCTWKNMPIIAIIALHKAEAQCDWKVEKAENANRFNFGPNQIYSNSRSKQNCQAAMLSQSRLER